MLGERGAMRCHLQKYPALYSAVLEGWLQLPCSYLQFYRFGTLGADYAEGCVSLDSVLLV